MIKFFRILTSGKTFFLFTFVTFVLILFFGNPSFGSTDDYLLSGFISGEYTGKKESRLVFIQYFPSMIFHLFSILFPSYSGIYSFLLVINIILSLNLFFNLVLKKKIIIENNSEILYTYYILAVVIISWMSLSPTYTASSFLGGVIYGSIILQILFQPTKKNYVSLLFITILFMFSALIRPESLLAIVPFFVLFIVFTFKSLKFKIDKIFLIGMTILVIYIVNESSYYFLDNSSWALFDEWNLMRHEIANRQPERYLNNYLDKLKWTSVEYNLFRDVAFGERSVFTNNWLQKGYDATEEFRGLEGILNADMHFGLSKLKLVILEWSAGFGVWLYVIFVYLRNTNQRLATRFIYFFSTSFLTISLLFYASLNLFIPDRVFFPLLITAIFLFINLYIFGSPKNYVKSKHSYISFTLGISVLVIFTLSLKGFIGQNNVNYQRKIEYQGIVNKLEFFDSRSIFFFPVNIDYYVIANPFIETFSSKTDKFLMLGNWDTFSPHWNERKKLIGLISESTYSNLLEMNNIYWIGQNTPDTGYNVELLLKEMGKLSFTREGKLKLTDELNAYSYYYVN